MQQIIAFSGGPEEYVRDGTHRKMRPPGRMRDLRKIRGNAPSRLLPKIGYDSRPNHASADPDTPIPLFLLSSDDQHAP
ncbi:MAG: hypothetical protein NTW21_00455 [Verrucomicrobia bacterium]|nr:hypothetical protein [Verrucomicrobiota bacterium]